MGSWRKPPPLVGQSRPPKSQLLQQPKSGSNQLLPKWRARRNQRKRPQHPLNRPRRKPRQRLKPVQRLKPRQRQKPAQRQKPRQHQKPRPRLPKRRARQSEEEPHLFNRPGRKP